MRRFQECAVRKSPGCWSPCPTYTVLVSTHVPITNSGSGLPPTFNPSRWPTVKKWAPSCWPTTIPMSGFKANCAPTIPNCRPTVGQLVVSWSISTMSPCLGSRVVVARNREGAPLPMKHKSLAVLFACRGQAGLFGDGRTCGLVQFANGEEGAAELGLVQLAQESNSGLCCCRGQPANDGRLDRLLRVCNSGRSQHLRPISGRRRGTRSNFTSRLHSTSGLGVRPAAYSSNM